MNSEANQDMQSDNEKVTRPPLLVLSDDWGRHPSSCQHLIRHLLPTYDVTWVNTIGMRPPRLDMQTVRRVQGKLAEWIRTKQPSGNKSSQDEPQVGPEIRNPKMWPWFRTATDRRLNKFLITRHLRDLAEPLPIAITTIPIVADLMKSLPVRRWVYYCVDDFSEWPGLDQEPLRRMDDEVIQAADVLIAASESLQEKLASAGRASELLTHGVDLDHWTSLNQSGERGVLSQFEGPLFLFWGVIDQRLDVEFLQALNDSLDKGTIVLVGPQQNPPAEIAELSRVKLLPPVEFDELPGCGHAADVLIMPYVDEPVSRAMQPLKLLEYLATGKPVVARDLPATKAWADCMELAATKEGFVAKVEKVVSSGVTDQQRLSRERLKAESWSAKAMRFEQLITQAEA